MSLINDALKRARQAQVRQPVAVAADPVLQPAADPAPLAERLKWALPAVALLILLAACWCFWLWWRSDRPALPTHKAAVPALSARPTNTLVRAMKTATAVAGTVAAARAQADLAMETRPDPGATVSTNANPATGSAYAPAAALTEKGVPKPPPTEAQKPSAASAVTPSPKSNAAAPAVAAEEPAPASFKLQGIFYRSTRASILVNGVTLFVGDEYDGAKVIAIDRHAARLLINGRIKVLRLK